MRLTDKQVLTAQDYFLATVQQVILSDVVQNNRVILQKFSVRCSVRTFSNLITRRYYGSTKMIQLPKVGQLVYVWKNDRDYFWTKRFDNKQKHNLGQQLKLGSTLISGSNHDVLLFNGANQESSIQLHSHSMKDDKFVSAKFFGRGGKITFMRSQLMISRSKKQQIIGDQYVVITSDKDVIISSDGDASIFRKKGVAIKDSQDRKTQPMVLGQKLSDWRDGLMSDVQNFLKAYDIAIAAGFAARGPAQGAGSRPYKGGAIPALKTLFLKSKQGISGKTFLSSKNKVS